MKNTYLIILILFGAFGLMSCLKSLKDVNLGDIKGAQIFEIAPSENPSLGANDRVYSKAYGISSTPQQLLIPIYLNSNVGTYSHDVTVTVIKDTAAITAYNDADTTGATNYEFLPDSTFNITGYSNNNGPFTVTIPAGQKFGYLTLNITSSKVYLFSQYMVSYKISAVPSGALISDSRTSAQWTVAIKNKYDGMYSLSFQMKNWGGYGIIDGGGSNPWSQNVGVVTNGLNTVLIDIGGSYAQPGFTASLAATSFGATKPQYTFDLTTNNLISVTNLTPDDGRGRTFHLNPNITDSRYDPNTGTIYAAYIMSQNGRPNQEIYDTLVYQSTR